MDMLAGARVDVEVLKNIRGFCVVESKQSRRGVLVFTLGWWTTRFGHIDVRNGLRAALEVISIFMVVVRILSFHIIEKEIAQSEAAKEQRLCEFIGWYVARFRVNNEKNVQIHWAIFSRTWLCWRHLILGGSLFLWCLASIVAPSPIQIRVTAVMLEAKVALERPSTPATYPPTGLSMRVFLLATFNWALKTAMERRTFNTAVAVSVLFWIGIRPLLQTAQPVHQTRQKRTMNSRIQLTDYASSFRHLARAASFSSLSRMSVAPSGYNVVSVSLILPTENKASPDVQESVSVIEAQLHGFPRWETQVRKEKKFPARKLMKNTRWVGRVQRHWSFLIVEKGKRLGREARLVWNVKKAMYTIGPFNYLCI